MVFNATFNNIKHVPSYQRGRRGRDRIVVGFTTTHAISAYHHLRCEFESYSWRGVLDTTLCHKVYYILFISWTHVFLVIS
jgi:hypothetical protein